MYLGRGLHGFAMIVIVVSVVVINVFIVIVINVVGVFVLLWSIP